MKVPIVNRFAAALLGSWIFSYGFVAIGTLLAFQAGMRFGQSQSLTLMLGLLAYLAALLWSFTARSNARVWAVLAGGGVAMALAAWGASRLLGP